MYEFNNIHTTLIIFTSTINDDDDHLFECLCSKWKGNVVTIKTNSTMPRSKKLLHIEKLAQSPSLKSNPIGPPYLCSLRLINNVSMGNLSLTPNFRCILPLWFHPIMWGYSCEVMFQPNHLKTYPWKQYNVDQLVHARWRSSLISIKFSWCSYIYRTRLR